MAHLIIEDWDYDESLEELQGELSDFKQTINKALSYCKSDQEKQDKQKACDLVMQYLLFRTIENCCYPITVDRVSLLMDLFKYNMIDFMQENGIECEIGEFDHDSDVIDQIQEIMEENHYFDLLIDLLSKFNKNHPKRPDGGNYHCEVELYSAVYSIADYYFKFSEDGYYEDDLDNGREKLWDLFVEVVGNPLED